VRVLLGVAVLREILQLVTTVGGSGSAVARLPTHDEEMS
jgi:hypothetical protein